MIHAFVSSVGGLLVGLLRCAFTALLTSGMAKRQRRITRIQASIEGDCGITRPLYDVDEKKSDKRQIINIC